MMRTREQLQQEYNEAIVCGDFYRAQDLKDEFESIEAKQIQAIASLEKAAKALLEKNPNFLEVTGQPG